MKRILSRFGTVTLSLLIASSALVATPAQAAGCEANLFAGGSGTEAAPFQIATAQQLANLSECLFDGKHFVLTADINASAFSPWTSISYFVGTFDGAFHTISNLNLSSASSSGLFNYVEDSVLRNVKISGTANVSSDVTSFGVLAAYTTDSTIQEIEITVDLTLPEGVVSAGGAVGYADNSDFSNVSFASATTGFTTSAQASTFGGLVGSIDSGSITDSEFSGNIAGSSTNMQVAGIVGNATLSTLTNLSVNGDITGRKDNIAGIVGYMAGTSLTKATHTGDSKVTTSSSNINVAGIVGYASASNISDVHQIGDVSGTTDSGMAFVGGIASYLSNSMSGDSTLSNATVIGDVTGLTQTGGIVGYLASKSPITNVSITGDVTGTQFVGGIAGYQTSDISQATVTGDVTATSNAGGISGSCYGAFGMDENFNFVTTPSNLTDVAVTGDITSNDGNPNDFSWLATGGIIGYAADCNVTRATAVGDAVGETFLGGAIGYASNATLNGLRITVDVTSTGEQVGGIIGYASDITMNDSFSLGTVIGSNTMFGSIGGIAGYASDFAANRIFHSGDVIGISAVGGMFGRATTASVTDGYVTGSITHDPSTEYPYAGLVAGSGFGITLTRVYVSGSGVQSRDLNILGNGSGEFNSVIQDSTADSTVGEFTSVMLKTSAEMKLAKTFRALNWDFPTVWMMNAPANNGMPMLRSLAVPSDCKVRNFSPILFKKGSAKLSSKAKANLTKFANQIAFGPCRNLKISGYTSTFEIGKKATPVSKLKKLAGQRAQAVKKYLNLRLSSLGDSFTVTISIRHKLSPVASNKKPAGQAKNRRVVAATVS